MLYKLEWVLKCCCRDTTRKCSRCQDWAGRRRRKTRQVETALFPYFVHPAPSVIIMLRTVFPPPVILHVLLATLGTISAQDAVVVNSGDLAVGRVFTASSTCGQEGPEQYCDIAGGADTSISNGERQCFTCDAANPDNAHPARFLTDLDSSMFEERTWWQAENTVGNVTLDLELGALFFFTHLVITFRSLKPAAAVIERSRDFGETYEPYQYYSEDCIGDFGMPDRSSIRTVDEVICTSEYSSIEPLTNGELIYRALPPSLGTNDYNTPAVINKITLTNLRIRFLRLNTLPGDDPSDPSTAMSYQYAVYSIVVRGWCFCNGHALACDPPPDVLQIPGVVNTECRCSGNTQGDNCEQCEPLFNDRPWLPANGPNQTMDAARQCQECQCYGRASSCHFDPQVAMETGGSGGVCDNCTHNTAGKNCELCVVGFYRNTSTLLSDPNMCLPCQCDSAGSANNGICFPDDNPVDLRVTSGLCECRANVEGERCDRCRPGYFNLSADNPNGCQPCECDPMGSEVAECHMTTGECTCKSHVTGRTCDTCEAGYCCMGSGGCVACDCDIGGSVSPECQPSDGSCDCRRGVVGLKCDSLELDHFLVTRLTLFEARKLAMNGEFSLWLQVDPDDYRNVSEVNFDLEFAAPDDVKLTLPEPLLCYGSDSHVTGGSIPFHEVAIIQDMESGQYYIQVVAVLCWSVDRVTVPYQLTVNGVPQPHEKVIVSPLPSARALLGSSREEEEEEEEEEDDDGLAECYQIPLVSSSQLTAECRAIAFSVSALLANGTLACDCDPVGSTDSTCAEINGQCPCAPGVQGRVCDTCTPGYYDLGADGCRECDCDPAGSLSPACNASTGQCDCMEGFTGQQCDRCGPNLYFSTADSDCVPCDCNEEGSNSTQCDREGQCVCKPGVRGLRCDECRPDHYNFTSTGCVPCECYAIGSLRDDNVCDMVTGECACVEGVIGRKCDACPAFSVGPSKNTVLPCVDCFCNGYSRQCQTEGGWYQANVVRQSGSDTGLEGFRSNGEITSNQGCLVIDPGQQSSLSVSLPNSFLGDKRTSYNQRLTFNLSIPDMASDDGCHVYVEVVGRLSRYRQVMLVAKIPGVGNQPQISELPLVPREGLLVDLWFWKRLASQRDIRQILANIRQLRLKVIFDNNTAPMAVQLCSVSLGYATNEDSDPYISSPPKNVNYVEQCSCPLNREGPRCENCAPGYTTDPSFGGEFARCVRCFCNFHSDSCDPVSGECFNCSDNTRGADCELCATGYFRDSNLRTDGCIKCNCNPLGTEGGVCSTDTGVCECREGFGGERCDQCLDEFWSPGLGQCRACNCDPEGSMSLVCDKTNGSCLCLSSSVVGERCDRCRQNSTNFFPTCDACDECSGQWQGKIDPLREDIDTTLELVRVMTVTVGPEDIPLLSELLGLLREVQELLSASQIDTELIGDVTALHRRLCELTNQTQDLFERAVTVNDEIAKLGGFGMFENETSRLAMLLMDLRSELDSLAEDFENITAAVSGFDPTFHLALAQEAEERSNQTDILISGNVTSLIALAERTLADYNRALAESNFLARQMENMRRLSVLSQRVSEYETFLVAASATLCGSGNDSSVCAECGGLQCNTCGGPECDSLVYVASEALNISTRALTLVEDARNETLLRVSQLRTLLTEILATRNDSLEAEESALEAQGRADEIWTLVQGLLETLLEQRDARIDLDDIEDVEQQTLSLQLDTNQEEFLEILVAINQTIDEIFSRFGVDATDLTRRAENALIRAQNAKALAVELAANASTLESLLQELADQEQSLRENLTQSENTNSETEPVISETADSLDQTESSLNSTRERLLGLSVRLAELEALVQQNSQDLATARNVTEEAENASAAVDQSSLELETDYQQLLNDTDDKLRASREQLGETEGYRDRTAALTQRTSQQILLVENLERTKAALVAEQETIRGDVQRLAFQLEELYTMIQVHIARNTACLDTGTQQKR